MPVKAVKSTAMMAACLVYGGTALNAQSYSSSLSRWEAGLSAGIFLYQGDLAPSRVGGYKDPKLGLNISLSRAMSASLALRAQFSLSTLKTNESDYDQPEWRQQRNLAFRTPLKEFSVQAVYYPKADHMDLPYGKTLSPYVFGGVSLSILNVQRDFTRFNADYFNTQPTVLAGVAADLAHRTPRVTPVIPVGAGLKYRFHPKWSVTGEAAYRLGFSDYIDGVSKAGNPNRKDHYYSVSIGVTYRPYRAKARGMGCPSVQ